MNGKGGWRRYLRAKVAFKVSKALVRGALVSRDDRKPVPVDFMCERHLGFCYSVGCLVILRKLATIGFLLLKKELGTDMRPFMSRSRAVVLNESKEEPNRIGINVHRIIESCMEGAG